MADQNGKHESGMTYLPIGMSIGISLGMAIGAAMGNIPIGMSMGISVGMCVGAAIDAAKRNKSEEQEPADAPSEEEAE